MIRSDMNRNAASARNAGLELIRRINRWMIAGAVAFTGMISVVAARSFHGHTASAATSSESSRSSSGSATGSSSSGGGLSQPSQAPSPAQSAPAPVVSGGS